MSRVFVTQPCLHPFQCTGFGPEPERYITPDELVNVLKSAAEPGPDREYVLTQTPASC